jgi:hypothetical protein
MIVLKKEDFGVYKDGELSIINDYNAHEMADEILINQKLRELVESKIKSEKDIIDSIYDSHPSDYNLLDELQSLLDEAKK